MIDVDARLRDDLGRLARALVPDEWESAVELERSVEPTPDLDGARPRRRLVMTAAALLVLAGLGAGLALWSTRDSSPSTPLTSTPGSGVDRPWPWAEGVEMIVYVTPGASQSVVDDIRNAIVSASDVVDVDRLQYFDAVASLADAAVGFADDPDGLALLNPDNIPTQFKVVPLEGQGDQLPMLKVLIERLPGVNRVRLRDDAVEQPGPTPVTEPFDMTPITSAAGDIVPTAANPAQVLLIGDSSATALAEPLELLVGSTGVAELIVDDKPSSGLVRDDFFDWPVHLAEVLPSLDPDIIVVSLGANDGQGFLDSPSRPAASAGWQVEYARRVGAFMDQLSESGRQVIWIGVPNAGWPDLAAVLAVQNEVVRAQAMLHPSVTVVDAWTEFTNDDGTASNLELDPRDGIIKVVRDVTDRFHLNAVGNEILAGLLATPLVDALVERGATTNGTSVPVQSAPGPAGSMPNLIGVTEREALVLLEANGLIGVVTMQTVAEGNRSAGYVIAQGVATGEQLAPGSTVSVVVAVADDRSGDATTTNASVPATEIAPVTNASVTAQS